MHSFENMYVVVLIIVNYWFRNYTVPRNRKDVCVIWYLYLKIYSSMTWGHTFGSNIKISCTTQGVDNAHDCTIIKKIQSLATVSKLIQLANMFFDKQCVLSRIRASCLHWMYIYLIYKQIFFLYDAWVFEITQIM